MKTRRRIEITAFRRAIVVFGDRSGDVSKSYGLSETERSGRIGIDSAQVGGDDLAEAQLTTVADSPELTFLIDALVKNDGDVAGAAKQLGLSRNDFISKLCGFGHSVK